VETVEGYVESGVKEGATLTLGGCRPDDPALQRGHYYMPTLFDHVSNDMRIAQEDLRAGGVGDLLPHRRRRRPPGQRDTALAATV
jgi:hypothetical protein